MWLNFSKIGRTKMKWIFLVGPFSTFALKIFQVRRVVFRSEMFPFSTSFKNLQAETSHREGAVCGGVFSKCIELLQHQSIKINQITMFPSTLKSETLVSLLTVLCLFHALSAKYEGHYESPDIPLAFWTMGENKKILLLVKWRGKTDLVEQKRK